MIRQGTRTGFFGKIPSRADFVQAGLSRAIVDAWHAWASAALDGSRSAMGEAWLPAWLEAPVWRFVLPPGMCGPDTILGLWMPSVDRVGRYFPFMIATSDSDADPVMLASEGVPWLEAAEEVGRNAIADDVSPSDIMARLPPPPEPSTAPGALGFVAEPDVGTWCTEGSPRVPAQIMALNAMPDVSKFVTMLDAVSSVPEEAR